jgi:uncharacterized protein (DUF433 family)
MDPRSIIESRPGVRSGQPCISGTRISVEDVLGYLASGMTIDQIIHDFPELNAELINAVIEFDSLRERSVPSAP